MRAILEKIKTKQLKAECSIVISDRVAKGLDVAAQMGFHTLLIDRSQFRDRTAHELEIVSILREHQVELVVCAGYLRIIGDNLLKAYPNRILNIHPSLLPSFPGLRAQKQALEHGVKITGCTIHLVDPGVDTGKILAQVAVPILPDDDEKKLSARILHVEHENYWRAIADYIKGA